jgi:hypothetical protein
MHCRKVAGTSIAALLSRYLGPDDIQVGTWPGSFQMGVRPNRRFYRDLLGLSELIATAKKFAAKPSRMLTRQRIIYLLNTVHLEKYSRYLGSSACHPTAVNAQAFDPEAWSEFYKFCFVRNPYERAVSDYLFINRIRNTDISFLEFLEKLETQTQNGEVYKIDFDNWPMYTIDDEVAVDYVGRFEDLGAGLRTILAQIGIRQDDQELKFLNSAPARYQYLEYYKGKVELNKVASLYEKEIDYFGYEFGE